jgi:hypothetical protein
MTYEEFVTLYEANWEDTDWFFGEFFHIKEQYPEYIDRYIASNMKKTFNSKKVTE